MTGIRTQVVGTISSVGFDGPHRFVVGCWHHTPIGPFADVMWADPDGGRTLLAGSDEAARFITAIYQFDSVKVAPLDVFSDGRTTRVDGHGLKLELIGGRRVPLPPRRPLWLTRFVESPIARLTMGVQTHGVSFHGATEWYQSSGWRWVRQAGGSLGGESLGPMRPVRPAVGVGFSEPPARPSIVSVRTVIDLPADAALGLGL